MSRLYSNLRNIRLRTKWEEGHVGAALWVSYMITGMVWSIGKEIQKPKHQPKQWSSCLYRIPMWPLVVASERQLGKSLL
jgi:hypothetical protein